MSNRIYLIGFMGSGKSRCAPNIAEMLKIPFIDTDALIEEEQGMTISDLFIKKGEATFRLLEKEIIHRITMQYTDIVVSTGGGLPCYHNNMQYMNTHGLTIYVNPPLHVLHQRLQSCSTRPLLKDKSSEEILEFIETKLAERNYFYTQAQWTINPAIIP